MAEVERKRVEGEIMARISLECSEMKERWSLFRRNDFSLSKRLNERKPPYILSFFSNFVDRVGIHVCEQRQKQRHNKNKNNRDFYGYVMNILVYICDLLATFFVCQPVFPLLNSQLISARFFIFAGFSPHIKQFLYEWNKRLIIITARRSDHGAPSYLLCISTKVVAFAY